MLRAAALLSGLAAAAAAARCPSATRDTCAVNYGGSSYSSSAGELTAAQCCEQCVLDGTLCYGYVFTPSAHGGDTGSCVQFDSPQHDTVPGNCTTGTFPHPEKAPPKRPKPAPKGAKNVLFIVAVRLALDPPAAAPRPAPLSGPTLRPPWR